MDGIPVRLVRFPQRNTQVLPLFAAERSRQKHQLAHVIRNVRERTMQRVVHLERLTTYGDGLTQVIVSQRVERTARYA
jgi:hypothetical protein